MATNDYTSTSSGRWDAAGSFEDAVAEQRRLALNWARRLSIPELRIVVLTMANDFNSYTLYERQAILETVALELGN